MAGIFTFNKYIVNPLLMHIAGTTNTSFAVIYHVGRVSKKQYKTPIIVRKIAGGFVAALTYGPKVNWYQNIKKANSCEIRWHKMLYAISGIETLSKEKGLAAFPSPFNAVLNLRGTKDFIFMRIMDK